MRGMSPPPFMYSFLRLEGLRTVFALGLSVLYLCALLEKAGLELDLFLQLAKVSDHQPHDLWLER